MKKKCLYIEIEITPSEVFSKKYLFFNCIGFDISATVSMDLIINR